MKSTNADGWKSCMRASRNKKQKIGKRAEMTFRCSFRRPSIGRVEKRTGSHSRCCSNLMWLFSLQFSSLRWTCELILDFSSIFLISFHLIFLKTFYWSSAGRGRLWCCIWLLERQSIEWKIDVRALLDVQRRRWQKHERLQCKSGSIHCCMHTRRKLSVQKDEEGGPHTAEVKTKHFMQVDNEFYFCSFFYMFHTTHNACVYEKFVVIRVLETIQWGRRRS